MRRSRKTIFRVNVVICTIVFNAYCCWVKLSYSVCRIMTYTTVVALLNSYICSMYLSLCQTVSSDFGCSYKLKDTLY